MEDVQPPEVISLDRGISEPLKDSVQAVPHLLARSPKNFAKARRSHTLGHLEPSAESPDKERERQLMEARLAGMDLRTPSPEKAKVMREVQMSASPDTPEEKPLRSRLVYDSVYNHL